MKKKNLLVAMISCAVIVSVSAEEKANECAPVLGGNQVEDFQTDTNTPQTCEITNPIVGDVYYCNGLKLTKIATDLSNRFPDGKLTDFKETIEISSPVTNDQILGWLETEYEGNEIDNQYCDYVYDPTLVKDVMMSIMPESFRVGQISRISQINTFSLAGKKQKDDVQSANAMSFSFALNSQYLLINNSGIDDSTVAEYEMYKSIWKIEGLKDKYRYYVKTSVNVNKQFSKEEFIDIKDWATTSTRSSVAVRSIVSLDSYNSSSIQDEVEVYKNENFSIRINDYFQTMNSLRIKNKQNGKFIDLSLKAGGISVFYSSDPLIYDLEISNRDLVELSVFLDQYVEPDNAIHCSKNLYLEGPVILDVNSNKTSSPCVTSINYSGTEMLEARHQSNDLVDVIFSVKDKAGMLSAKEKFGLEIENESSYRTPLIDWNSFPVVNRGTKRLINMPLYEFVTDRNRPVKFFVTGSGLNESLECKGEYTLGGRHRFIFDGVSCYQY